MRQWLLYAVASMFCPRCDAQNAEGAMTCVRCGSPMSAGTMVMASVQSVPRPVVSIRVVRADGGPENVVPMKQDVLICGRTGDIAFPEDPFVAQQQAKFFFSGARLAIEDVGGNNGVFVRLRQERDLPIGGELRLGRQRLVAEPIPSVSPGAGGAIVWGSPDQGYRFRLVQLIEGGVKGGAFPLREGENHLGREIGDITFPTDGFVSGKHAQLRVQADHLFVKDVGSSNGTFIRLSAPAFVENGDQFLIGRQLLRIELAPPK